MGSNAWLSVLHSHTNKFAALAGIGCSSVGVANLEITAGGFQYYPTLGINFKTPLALGWVYCFPWQRAVHAQLPLPPSGCSALILSAAPAVHGSLGGPQGRFVGFLQGLGCS